MNEALGAIDIFKDFTGREDDLRSVTRYSLYRVMFYRTNLFTHSHRTAALVRAINPIALTIFGSTYDPRKAELLALVHDDAEIVFGDVQAGNKSKMTAKQLQEVRNAEQAAIGRITQRFPSQLATYAYSQLLSEAADYSSLEAQVVCYADKYDALGEALHEIYAGNDCFVTNVVNEYGRIPIPTDYYATFFQEFAQKFPALRSLLAMPFPMFERVEHEDYSTVASNGRLHTLESIYMPSGNHHYDTWKHFVLADSIDEVLRDLHGKKEPSVV